MGQTAIRHEACAPEACWWAYRPVQRPNADAKSGGRSFKVWRSLRPQRIQQGVLSDAQFFSNGGEIWWVTGAAHCFGQSRITLALVAINGMGGVWGGQPVVVDVVGKIGRGAEMAAAFVKVGSLDEPSAGSLGPVDREAVQQVPGHRRMSACSVNRFGHAGRRCVVGRLSRFAAGGHCRCLETARRPGCAGRPSRHSIVQGFHSR